ncbi:UNVERIFIED_CONTAM: hypothetical protein Sradi_6977100 [Sesamum radiatum]|uniref:Uncharacterized protein n=1 Tax=Sesamum radiatum TaxID=300843 RepID=A0AAW2JE92_SESRA
MAYGGELTFTLDNAIPLTDQDNKKIPMNDVYALIYKSIQKYAERYDGQFLVRLMIRVYMTGEKKERPLFSLEGSSKSFFNHEPRIEEIKPIPTKEIRYHKSSYPTHITALKPCHTKLKPFIVADIETLLIDDVHKPYAAGLGGIPR